MIQRKFKYILVTTTTFMFWLNASSIHIKMKRYDQIGEIFKTNHWIHLGQLGYFDLFIGYVAPIELNFTRNYKISFSTTFMFCAKPNSASNLVKQNQSEQGR